MRRNVRVALRQKNGFPCPSRIHKWTITLLSRHLVPLRQVNWEEDLLFNRINVKLKCAVFIFSNIFFHSDILNFETNLFPIVAQAKIVMHFSRRGNFGLKSQPALKWNAQVKLWKQTLRYPASWETKKRPHWPVRKAFARRLRIFFPRVRTIRNQFKHLVVSSRQQLTRLQCVQSKFAYHHVAMGEILIVSTVFCTKLSPKQRLNRE